MYGTEKYLEQNYPKHIYSEILYLNSIVGVARKNYREFGAVAILITGIWVSFEKAQIVDTVYTLTDNFDRLIFSLNQSPDANGFHPMNYIIIAANLNFTSVAPAGLDFLKYSLQHQYLMVPDKV